LELLFMRVLSLLLEDEPLEPVPEPMELDESVADEPLEALPDFLALCFLA
jgi:hypothetical protein